MRQPPSIPKKVILYRWDRQPQEGFVNAGNYLQEQHLEWLTADGRVQTASLEACKALCFVSEGAKADLFTESFVFERRPRMPGLWTRFLFRDGTLLEAILPANLLEWPTHGFLATPPPLRSLRQRVFIPRLAVTRTELRGVIGGASARLGKSGQEVAAKGEKQLSIFD